MKYASVFATILFVWIASIIVALTTKTTGETFLLYVSIVILTVVLFIIGFTRGK